MTPTLWLLAGLVLLIVVCLLGYAIAKAWKQAEEALTYNTLDVFAMNRDLRKINAQVPSERVKAKISREVELKQTADSVRGDGERAADREFDHRIPSINPHQKASRWNGLWESSRKARLAERQYQRFAGNSEVHTSSQPGG
jgi:hypothetical protein